MPRFQVRPGQNGSVTGLLRRRDGDDFRLEALLCGVEWELPKSKGLLAQCRKLLPWPMGQCEVRLRVRWVETEEDERAWAAWRVERRSKSVKLRNEQGQLLPRSAGR